LKTVRKAEKLIAQDTSLNHEYQPIAGHDGYRVRARALLLGADSPAIKENRAVTVQTISGTGALSLGGDFLVKFWPKANVYLPDPTWPNHPQNFARSGVKNYRYWDEKTRGLDFKGMIEDINNAPSGSIILLHACAHNPTGVDPTRDQWKKIAEVIKAKNHFTFFDSAYQGFATGDLDGDAWAIRHFVSQGLEMLIAQSFAKNFGLYDCRIGALTVVAEDAAKAAAALSQLEIIIRATYSNPPSHGARIVNTILSDPELTAEWREELSGMSGRIIQMRRLLFDELKRLGTPGDWTHITSQIGMFSYTGLNKTQCQELLSKHIYLLLNGRISMTGINTSNVKYLAQSIHEAVTKAR